jgi:hypothetical protein
MLVPFEPNALEVFILALCVLSGAAGPFLPPQAQVPQGLNWGWWLLLVLGGLTGLVGAYWRDAVTSMLVLRAALIPVGAGAYGWAIAIGHTGRPVDLYGAAVTAFFGICAHLRALQLSRFARGHQ